MPTADTDGRNFDDIIGIRVHPSGFSIQYHKLFDIQTPQRVTALYDGCVQHVHHSKTGVCTFFLNSLKGGFANPTDHFERDSLCGRRRVSVDDEFE